VTSLCQASCSYGLFLQFSILQKQPLKFFIIFFLFLTLAQN